MTTWDEIRDEVAGMLADGQPLEDVLAKLEKRKNEMAKPMTNEEWIKQCTTEQLAEFLYDIAYFDNWSDAIMNDSLINETAVEDAIEKWLKQPHTNE